MLTFVVDVDGGLLEQQIENLDLNVGIAWIGDRLNSFVEDQMSQDTPSLLFFNWIPNDLTATGRYSRSPFPMCQLSQSPPKDCDFEVHQLTKMVWSKIKSHTPEAYHLISQMELGQDEVNDLLVDYSKRGGSSDHDLESAACAWVKANEPRWRSWVPEHVSSKTPIYLGGMFPITGPVWRQPGIVPGLTLRTSTTILPLLYVVIFVINISSPSSPLSYMIVWSS